MKTVNCKLQTVNFLKLFAFLFVFIILHFTVSSFNLSSVFAQTRLQYPIPELGYCRDAKECYLYCEIPENKAACWSYSKYKVGSDVLGVTTMSEEEKEMMRQKAKQYAIAFPIADLGNCPGPQECRDFCEQPANQQACMDFAKKKGFQKEVKGPEHDELLQKARVELGCTSTEECRSICESDRGRCEAFAKKHGMYQEPPSQGRYSAKEKQELMQKAESELGCTSMESCKSICEKNPQACMMFAKKHGFDRPEPREGEMERREEREPERHMQGSMTGKCDSEESCKTYCQEHPSECPGFQNNQRATGQQPPSGSQSIGGGTHYVGPSGCRTEGECNNWCNDHPDKCPGFSQAKAQEESGKREYEFRKKQIEQNQETQKRQFENQREMKQQYDNDQPSGGYQGSGGGSQRYPSTSTQPSYNTTQPSFDSYTPPPTSPQGSGSTTQYPTP